MTAEPQNNPSKAKTMKARVARARRCRRRYSRDACWKDVDLGFAGPSTLRRRSASARLGRDAERSKTGMGCFRPLYVPAG